MKVPRRSFVRTASLTGGAATLVPSLAGCNSLVTRLSHVLGQKIPAHVGVADGADIDPVFHLLSRAAYGPWPGEIERVRAIGAAAWIEEQLAYETIDDRLCDLRARRFETLQHNPGTCYEYKKPVLREEIARHTLLRAVYSRRQLYEVMVNFWTDHFNINIEKSDCIYLKPTDDREVIRGHALGNFRRLLRASATSPAMLVYLDGKENKKEKPGDTPNENYARELMELHTLGVRGGYTQRDVAEVARCLTGWRLRDRWRKGTVYFDRALHDDGAKQVLGHTIAAGGGEKDLEDVIDIVCRHPATAKYLAWKLTRRFVAEEPPADLVERAAQIFAETDGEIKPVVRAILTSEEFQNARGAKFKQPFRFVASCLRMLGADTHAAAPLLEFLTRMGQGLFQYPTPDGYPDRTAPWLGTLLWRWNFAFALASNRIPSAEVALDALAAAIGATSEAALDPGRLFAYFVGRGANDAEAAALGDFLARAGGTDARAELFGLILSAPAFQRY
ncbi:MAG TPA: DUF1800 domain-containing protein [Pyrinomonadaceae bacterium]|nr:DUF1800 domain-containing protein [Pyrinomonadaceae bacterium]